MSNPNGKPVPGVGAAPMFPIPIELNGVRVMLNGDGTVSGETEKFLKRAPKLLQKASAHINVLTWLMVNAIRREVLASAAMSERLDGVALVDAKGEVEG